MFPLLMRCRRSGTSIRSTVMSSMPATATRTCASTTCLVEHVIQDVDHAGATRRLFHRKGDRLSWHFHSCFMGSRRRAATFLLSEALCPQVVLCAGHLRVMFV